MRAEPIDEHIPPVEFEFWPQTKKDAWFADANRDIVAKQRRRNGNSRPG